MQIPIHRKIWDIGIKGLVVILLGWVIYKQIFEKENAAEVWQSFQACFQSGRLYLLLLNLALIPINWGLEAKKWQLLIRHFSDYPFWQIFKAILAGVTVSLFTPNRVGEYGGRILLVEKEHNLKAVIATMVGSFSQLLILIALGLLGLIYFCVIVLTVEIYLVYTLFCLGALLIAFMLFCFYNVDLFVQVAKRITFLHRFKEQLKQIRFLQAYTSTELTTTLLFSCLRYLVYSTQYYLMLLFFGVEVHWIAAYAGIATIYLIQSGIPLPPVIDLFARGEVALFVWQHLWAADTPNTINILASTYTLFLFNLIVPALIGAIFILQVNISKSLGLDR